MKSVGDHIKQSRLVLGLSQANAAKKLEISAAAFCKIETGQTDLNISRLVQIANLFKVPVIQLLAGKLDSNGDASEEIMSLKLRISEQEEEINKLRKKVIDLYDKLGI